MKIDKKTKNEIKEFAKGLYLQIDETGSRVYSLTKIADEIRNKFDVSLTKQSLSIWSQKEGWELLLQQARNLGIERQITEGRKEDDKELSIRDELSKKTASYRQAGEISHISSKYTINKILQIVSEVLREREMRINEMHKSGELTKDEALDEKLLLVKIVSEHVSIFNLNLIANSSLDQILKLDSNFRDNKIDPVTELVNILRQVK
jgi:hypothetical protein